MRKRPKYGNVPTVVDGVRFASKAEAKRDAELQLLSKAGRIRNIKRQPRFPLSVDGQKITTYVGDWAYEEWTGVTALGGFWKPVVEDRKGALTKDFKIKWALAKALNPQITWRIT